jgi:hypothetical protein
MIKIGIVIGRIRKDLKIWLGKHMSDKNIYFSLVGWQI